MRCLPLRVLTALLVVLSSLPLSALVPPGGPLAPSPALAAPTISTLDSGGNVGFYTSLVLNGAGRPVVSYLDVDGNLKIAVCGDTTCRTGTTVSTLDSTSLVGYSTSLALDSGGRPVVSYYKSGALKIAFCGDTTCNAGNILRTVDDDGGVGNVGWYSSLALDGGGRPVVSYLDPNNNVLKIAVCGDTTCNAAPTIRTLESVGSGAGHYTSLALDGGGRPVVSYYDATGGNLKIAVCGDSTCNTTTIRTLDIVGDVGQYTSLALDSGGRPVVSYWDVGNGNLKIAFCGDTICSAATITTLDSADNVGDSTSLALDSGGRPVVSYHDTTNGNLKLILCGDTTCSTAPTIRTLDSAGDVGYFTSLALDSGGRPVVSYYDNSNGDLKLIACGDTTCQPNTPPAVTASVSSLAYTENAAATAIDPGLTVTDADGGNLTGATVQITAGCVSGEDVLAFTNQLGITGSYTAATCLLTLTGTAAVASYQTALQTVTYRNSSENPSTAARTVTFSANDGSATGSATRSITVTAANDVPVVTATAGSLAYTENAAATATDAALTISDADSANLTSATVQITTGCASGEDILAFTDQSGITGSYTAATCLLTLTGAAAVASYQTALRTVTYRNSSDIPSTAARTVTFTASDGGDADTGSATRGITVTAVNDAPVVTATAGGLAYTENAAATAIDSGLTVTDVDSTNLTGATVQITAGCASSEDVLGFTNQLGITGSYATATCLLTLSGATTVANYQTALRTVTYRNSSDNPSTAARTVTFTANDGSATGAATRSITVTAVNEGPVNTVPGAQTVNEDATLTFSAATGNLIAIADADAGGSAVQAALTATNGTLSLSGTAGLTFSAGDGTADAAMTFTGSVASINTALAGMSFRPTAHFNGAASVQIATSDQGNSGTGGAFSDSDTVAITVSPVNDAPSFTKGADQAVNEDAGPQTVAGWATGISAGPADEAGQTLTFLVTNNNNGLFSGQPGISSAGALTYTVSDNANGAATVTVQLRDNGDTANGGSDTSAAQTFPITVNAVNDAPGFTKGADQLVLVTAGAQTVAGWATGISAGPADEAAQTLTFLVTNDQNGLFSVQPAVSANGTLTYTPAAAGTTIVTTRLQDSGGTANDGADTSAPQTFTIDLRAATGGGGGGGGGHGGQPAPPAPSSPGGPARANPAPASGSVGPAGGDVNVGGGASQPGGATITVVEQAGAQVTQLLVAVIYAPPAGVQAPSGTSSLAFTVYITTQGATTGAVLVQVHPTSEHLGTAGGRLENITGGLVVPLNGIEVFPTTADPIAGTVTVTLTRLPNPATVAFFTLVRPGPALAAPEPGAHLGAMGTELHWTEPAGSRWGHLQLVPFNNDGPGIDLILFDAGGRYTVRPPDLGGEGNYVLLPGLTYVWRVRAAPNDASPTEADWSPWTARLFHTPTRSSDGIRATAPVPDAAVGTLTPTLTWENRDRDVFYYEVQLSRDPTFSSEPGAPFLYWELVHGGAAVPTNSYRVPAAYPLEGTAHYYWRVRPRVQGNGEPVTWSEAFSFRTPPGSAGALGSPATPPLR